MGSMLHHRFPSGFNDLFMDETDREVCTLTDRAFRSLCVGDDAVYNDELLCGYSPFSCRKPLAGEPLKKTHHKESKKQGKTKNDKNYAQHQKRISHMSSFLKALSATEESCEGMLIKNGGIIDSKEESWDKSALRSIQRELSEFSSDFHTSFKDVRLPSGKSSKTKKVKSTVKLRKLNIKNFFFHSEFSPFQVWRDLNRSFGLECTVLPTDNVPKWYDMSFYKELTKRHREDMLREEEEQSCQKVTVEPLPPTAPKSILPSPPPKVLPKPSTTPVEKKSSSDGGDESSAPWRRNRSRTKSVIPGNQAGIPLQENRSKPVDESLPLIKKEIHSVEVKAAEEVNSLASTPFSICQLMTPLIPSRQPTETSEILQGILSPSILDLPLRPHSDAKLTPEPPVKRDSYKSLASSILFNLKDNRKRVKSHYSPPKFKSSEVAGGDNQPLETYGRKHPETTSDGDASGLSTPAISKDGQRVCSPILESNSILTDELPKQHTEKPISDDYLLSHLLQSKRAAPGNGGPDEENSISPFIQSNTKNHIAKKQNYPSLNLYKKSSPIESDMKYFQVPLSSVAPIHKDQPTESNGPKTLMLNKEISPKAQPKTTVPSPNTINVSSKDYSPVTAPSAFVKEGLSAYLPSSEIRPNVRDKAKQPAKDSQEKQCSGLQPVTSSENDTNGQPVRTKDVIKAAREAINAAKSKALSAIQSDSAKKPISDMEEQREKEKDRKVAYSTEVLSSKRESLVPEKSNISCHGINEATLIGKKGKKEPQPIPKRNLAKSNIQPPADKHQEHNDDKLINGDLIDAKLDLPPNDNKSVQKPVELKHVFSARQNNYIKSQRYSVVDVEHREEFEEGDQKVNTGMEMDDKRMILREIRDSRHIINDLQALKELERAKLGDHVLINAKKKIGLVNIEEEARTKNDLISKELKNIKKGMLSMRGNTLAKRDLFASKEREQNKKDVFTKRDSNVIVNKALFNDNYDKAKMALEEIISERQKRKNKTTEPDVKPISDGDASDESYVTGLQKDYTTENNEQHGSNIPLKEDLKERLGDLRDHNHMRQILRQTEPGLSETCRLGARMVLSDELADNPSYESEENVLRCTERWICDERSKNVIKQNEDNKGEPPSVPPRSKKPGSRRDVCVTEEVDSLENVARDDIFVQTNGKKEQHLKELMSTSSEKHEADIELSTNESVHSDNDTDCNKEKWKLENTSNPNIHNAAALIHETTLPSTCSQSKNRLHLEEVRLHDNEALRADMSFTTETLKNINDEAQETYKLKQNVPLNLDPLNILDDSATKNLAAEDSTRNNKAAEEIHMDAEAVSEIPRDVISPLLLINGINISQSPPDQSSLSSKSSYFSVESALHRTLETGSNVYHSLENLTGEVEGADEATHDVSQKKKDKTEVDYCALSNYEIEAEVEKMQIESQEKEALCEDSKDRENMTTNQGVIPVSPSNTFSQPLGMPSLFKVKDNTSINKKKAAQPWSPRGSLSGSERGEDELHQIKEISDFSLTNEPVTARSTPIPEESLEPKEIPPSGPPPQVQTPSKTQSKNRKTPEFGEFLTVPQQDDRFSGVSPSSVGVESLTTSTADTGDDLGLNVGGHLEPEVSKVPSERSGSTCSGNESQAGLPKPPAVLPKSEKAVLKAIKLTKRRMKKEVQTSSQRSSQSSSRHRAEGHKSEKPEHTSSTSRNPKNSEKNGEKGHRHSKSYDRTGDGQNEKLHSERRSHNSETHRSTGTDKRQSTDSVESIHQNRDSLPRGTTEREGRSSNRHVRERPQQRHYSSDTIISNVPVYKAHIGEKPKSDRTFQRSQSIERHLGTKAERRFSADMSVKEKLDLRTQRIEKSIMGEFQQRGRPREMSRENPLRRSHSIDAYSTDVLHPSALSRQSSHTSQISRQSSREHAIITQSFPMTQRKLLQDPDSGQYFFVDMPVQVKTKTFFDPESGGYVQLPVQPAESVAPQASPLEVLTPPLVVYHSFVPVPLSAIAQNAAVHGTHTVPEVFEQRHTEGSQQTHCKERQPYLEPVYAQHDHMIGEFLSTEELDCPS